jgi:hypothetical protein
MHAIRPGRSNAAFVAGLAVLQGPRSGKCLPLNHHWPPPTEQPRKRAIQYHAVKSTN